MIRKHKRFSFHYSPSTSFSGLFFSPLETFIPQLCRSHAQITDAHAGVLVRRLAAGGWVRLCEECYCTVLYAAYAKRVSVTRTSTRIDVYPLMDTVR